MKENQDKINFFKKLYISIFKIKEYETLLKEGIKKAIAYVIKLAFIVSIIYAGIIITKSTQNANKLKAYLTDNLPDFTIQDNLLNIETENKIILDNELLKVNIGGRIIIDMTAQKDELVNEYKKDNETSLLLTKDKIIIISSKGETKEKNYQEALEYYFQGEITNFNKEILLSVFDTIPYEYYFLIYTLSYCITILIVILVYDLSISLLIFGICKIQKKRIKFIEIFTMGLYALTLFVIGYTIIRFIPLNISSIIRLLLIGIVVVYIVNATWRYKQED